MFVSDPSQRFSWGPPALLWRQWMMQHVPPAATCHEGQSLPVNANSLLHEWERERKRERERERERKVNLQFSIITKHVTDIILNDFPFYVYYDALHEVTTLLADKFLTILAHRSLRHLLPRGVPRYLSLSHVKQLPHSYIYPSNVMDNTHMIVLIDTNTKDSVASKTG